MRSSGGVGWLWRLGVLGLLGCHGGGADGSGGSTGAATTSGSSASLTSSGSGGSTSTGSSGGDPELTSSGEDGSTTEEEPPIVAGLRAQYWSDYHDLALVQVEPVLEVDWQDGMPDPAVGADHFSVRWSGWLTPPTTAIYTIVTETDDGVRVWIDDTLLIDDWTPQFVERNEAQVSLTAGVAVPLEVEYFEVDLTASARLAWSAPDLPEETIPTDALTTIAVADDEPSPKPPYENPVVAFDCPDPGVIAVPDAAMPGYYMVCTGGTFPIRYSRDLVRWQDTGAAVLPDGKPTWALNGFRNWAPEIHRVGDQFVAYYTTTDQQDRLCIGASVADEILGPYTESAGPLVQDPQGVIDATYYEAEGKRWLLYKIDGNAYGNPTPNLLRELADDGLSFAPGSQAIELITNDPGSWEGGVLEAAYLTEHDGMYYMFYSGNVYDHRYRTGVARAPSITGPWEKHGPPILDNNERWVGPGHGTVLHVEGVDWFFYHAWTNAGDGTNLQGPGRHGLLDRIEWVDGWPQIHDGTPSRSLQAWPGDDP